MGLAVFWHTHREDSVPLYVQLKTLGLVVGHLRIRAQNLLLSENRLRGRKQRSSDTSEPHRGLLLLASSLCRGQEERTMREPEVQIGNSGSDDTKELGTKQVKLISGEHRLR